MHTYSYILNDPHWFIITSRMRLTTFFYRFKSVSEYYRKISNSKSRLLGKSNREFFKNINGGFYRSTIENDEISITFYLRFNDLNRIYSHLKELSIRIKKIQFCQVEINEINMISITDKILLEMKCGINLFQKIRNTYSMTNRNIKGQSN
jgi:hypothetical protein